MVTCCLLLLAFGMGLIVGAIVINSIKTERIIQELADAIKQLKDIQFIVNSGSAITTTEKKLDETSTEKKPVEDPPSNKQKDQQQPAEEQKKSEKKPENKEVTTASPAFSKQYEEKKDSDGYINIKIQFYGEYQGDDEDFTVCMNVKPIELTEEERVSLLGGKNEVISKNYTKFMFKKLEEDEIEILDHEWGEEVHILSYNTGNDVWEFKKVPEAAYMSLCDEIAENLSKTEPGFKPEICSDEHCIYNITTK